VRVAVIGARGQLGRALLAHFADHEAVGWTHDDLEVADLGAVRAAVGAVRPDVVVNTAAFHRVDECEADPERAFRVNALGARNVAVAATGVGARVLYVSSDYVFGGDPRARPWSEFDPPAPVNVYGRSKLAGEELTRALCPRHFIVRVSGLFGPGGSRDKGGNFVEKILRQAETAEEIRVVTDVHFSPTFTWDAARVVAALVATEAYGTYHVVNQGIASWFDLAAHALRLAGRRVRLVPVTLDELALAAPRPRYSALDPMHLRLDGWPLPRPWPEALAAYLTALVPTSA